jgi:hypothetical protein
MQQPSERPPGPVERLSNAREARDRSHDVRERARGTSGELAKAVELQAAEREIRAREAWVEYVERTDGV